jgi:hypothetical protein
VDHRNSPGAVLGELDALLRAADAYAARLKHVEDLVRELVDRYQR